MESLKERARWHRALGDPSRLALVDALQVSDRTPGQLRELTGLDWNLLAFHLGALEDAGVVERRASEGDRRRRYVRLRTGTRDRLPIPDPAPQIRKPVFICTGNSARSPFAAALWSKLTGQPAASAGHHPAPAVHPLAVEVAADFGLNLADVRPRGYDDVALEPDVVVSVCDRAQEGGIPWDRPRVHWSVRDPASGDRSAFEAAFQDIAERLRSP